MIVLDASALVVSLTDVTARGSAVRKRLVSVASVQAPDLVNSETISSLRRLRRMGTISPAGHRRATAGLVGISLHRVPTTPFIERISELAENVTPYDAAYVALAESLGCPLLTADRRLAHARGPRCDFELM
jgi:predicted nucleic acid-binding protein